MQLLWLIELVGLRPGANFSCAEPNVNELSSLFHFICIRFGAPLPQLSLSLFSSS